LRAVGNAVGVEPTLPDVVVTMLEVTLVVDGEVFVMLPTVFDAASAPEDLGAGLAVVGEASFCRRTGPKPEIAVACKPSSKAAWKNDLRRMMPFPLCPLHLRGIVKLFFQAGGLVVVSSETPSVIPGDSKSSLFLPQLHHLPSRRASMVRVANLQGQFGPSKAKQSGQKE
jgi:hypothetical protein